MLSSCWDFSNRPYDQQSPLPPRACMPYISFRWDPCETYQNPILLVWIDQSVLVHKLKSTLLGTLIKACASSPISLSPPPLLSLPVSPSSALTCLCGPSSCSVYFLQFYELWVINSISMSLVVCSWTVVHHLASCASLNKWWFNKVWTAS